VKPNPQWVANIKEQQNQSTGDVDFPPALQWARRAKWFSFENIVLWGLGLPLGILAWAGFLWVGWRILKGDWQRHALLWGWTAFYFTWQSQVHNPTMRYQLPIYPALAIFAGFLVVEIYNVGRKKNDESGTTQDELQETNNNLEPSKARRWLAPLAIGVGGLVLIATCAWAFAFTRIYMRPITRVAAARWIYQNVPGPINLHIQTANGMYNQPLPFQENQTILQSMPFSNIFEAKKDGVLSEIYLAHVIDHLSYAGNKTLELSVSTPGETENISRATISADFLPVNNLLGEGFLAKFEQPISLVKGSQYQLIISLEGENSEIGITGSAPANESSWDDGLPLRIDGYDGYGGIYQRGLIFEMYWDDNTEKYLRFTNTLEQADYIFISSNRQWGTTTRIPERYPLTIAFYRHLIGCPPEKEDIWCYNVAEVGKFQGDLGFELVQVFESYPSLGSLTINDQFAEEAFTVYDHPKVLIFRKTGDFDPQKVSKILGMVDLTQVVHVTPLQASKYPGNLMLPTDRWSDQQAGGTWSMLFDTHSLLNRYPFISVIVWYLAVALLGWVVYPLVRRALSGLADHGYPLARITGLLLLSYLVWLAGSFRIPFSRLTISLVFLLLVLINGYLAIRDRQELQQEWSKQKKYYLLIEGLFLVFFILDLAIRVGNPDLWHPAKGGEKPMDFSYLNAVLKSTSFPPYDPWYAGGYINYYYYGFVLVGVLVKWLGIVPSVAYNLILPTVFAMIVLGAFSIGWNLVGSPEPRFEAVDSENRSQRLRLWAGMAGGLGMAVLGNLGIVKMVFEGYQKLAAPGGIIEGSGLLARWMWAFQGFVRVLTGAPLPYGLGDWYWNPSRVIPALNETVPITEFPFFTVLYADPHAHLFAMTLALLVLSFCLSIVLSREIRLRNSLLAFMLGGLAIGALWPTNMSDYYPYLALGCVAVVFALWRNGYSEGVNTAQRIPFSLPNASRHFVRVIVGVGLLIVLTRVFFQPYIRWYGQGYSQVELWKGTHTPLSAYFTHWGLFLFLIFSWMVWETREWMARTPVSALRKLEPYRGLIFFLLLLLFGIVLALMLIDVSIAWFVLPLAAWAGVLILRPGQSDAKRFVLFLVGTGLVLTLMVEVIVVRGDIARMNTVFKFYLEVWTLFAVSAAAAFGWLLADLPKWTLGWRGSWQVALLILGLSAALYPILAGIAKVKDRMATNAPHTVDGMAYMAYAQYADSWGTMDLSQDYRAIRWMQENVTGSPVIVEANLRNLYRWGSRFSIYTGLPGVVGWEWHQQQQRALLPGAWVSSRISEIENFYQTTNFQSAKEFLDKYNVRYIILGQQERGLYPGPGLDKFTAANGIFWREVYRERDTVIYEVIRK
jgi:YYY domain-containing protein